MNEEGKVRAVMTALDGSDYGETAGAYALDFAQRLHASLSAVHVVDRRMLEGPFLADLSGSVGALPYGNELANIRNVLEERGRTILEAYRNRAAERGLEADTRLEEGLPVRALLRSEEDADLLVFGQRGDQAEASADLPGSTAERLIRRSSRPCLVTPRSFVPVQRIMTAYDGSGPSRHALQRAAVLARGLEADMVVVTVAERDDSLEEDAAHATLQEGKDLAAEAGIHPRGRIAEGDPQVVLPEAAAGEECQMLALGVSHHSWLSEHLVGSLSLRMVHETHLPVLLVR